MNWVPVARNHKSLDAYNSSFTGDKVTVHVPPVPPTFYGHDGRVQNPQRSSSPSLTWLRDPSQPRVPGREAGEIGSDALVILQGASDDLVSSSPDPATGGPTPAQSCVSSVLTSDSLPGNQGQVFIPICCLDPTPSLLKSPLSSCSHPPRTPSPRKVADTALLCCSVHWGSPSAREAILPWAPLVMLSAFSPDSVNGFLTVAVATVTQRGLSPPGVPRKADIAPFQSVLTSVGELFQHVNVLPSA